MQLWWDYAGVVGPETLGLRAKGPLAVSILQQLATVNNTYPSRLPPVARGMLDPPTYCLEPAVAVVKNIRVAASLSQVSSVYITVRVHAAWSGCFHLDS